MNDILTKTFKAGAAINPRRLLKIGAADWEVIEAVDGAAAIIGVSPDATFATGDRIDVQMMGIAKVRIDGTPARGTYVTATTAGKGAAAAPAAGVNSNVAGIILVTAADEDMCDVLLAPSRIQG